MSFANLLGRRADKWDNPTESLGTFIGIPKIGHLRYRCWEAGGKARAAFQQLSPEIKELLEASGIPPPETVSWSIYMIGHTENTASPKILICSTEAKTRKAIRKLIKDSKIVRKYPGIGLGDVSVLPDRQSIRELSREAIQALLPAGHDVEGAVLAEHSVPTLGMRLFAVDPDHYSLRPITGGPIVWLGGAPETNKVDSSWDPLWIGKIGNHDIPVAAALPRYGLVLGNLTATPSYLRMPGQITFQLVYPVRFNEAVVDGDCGAPVMDKSNGHFYGHIVAGGPGSRIGFLIPASEVAEDIETRFGEKLSLYCPEIRHTREIIGVPSASACDVDIALGFPRTQAEHLVMPPSPIPSSAEGTGIMKYRILVRQQPVAAQSCGFGERDRRVIDPPPVVQLLIDDPDSPPEEMSRRIRHPFSVVHCSIWDETGEQDNSAMPEDFRQQRRLMGTLVASPFVGLDQNGDEGCFFCFPDVSCRTPGTFRLKFNLVVHDPTRMRPGGLSPIIATALSEVFTVYNAKDFPGMTASTALTKRLKEQGCLISIKKGNEKSGTSHAQSDGDDRDSDDDDDDGKNGRAVQKPGKRGKP